MAEGAPLAWDRRNLSLQANLIFHDELKRCLSSLLESCSSVSDSAKSKEHRDADDEALDEIGQLLAWLTTSKLIMPDEFEHMFNYFTRESAWRGVFGLFYNFPDSDSPSYALEARCERQRFYWTMRLALKDVTTDVPEIMPVRNALIRSWCARYS